MVNRSSDHGAERKYYGKLAEKKDDRVGKNDELHAGSRLRPFQMICLERDLLRLKEVSRAGRSSPKSNHCHVFYANDSRK